MSLSQIDLRTRFENKYASKFNAESWCISELYWSFLKDYPVGKVKKCLIQVSDDWGDELYKYTNWSDCKGVNLEIDFVKYFSLDDYQRKEMLLSIINKGMIFIADKENWEVNALLDAFNSCIKSNLNYAFLVRNKLKTSPNKQFKFGLWCEWDINTFKIFWVLLDKNKTEIRRELLISEAPSLGEFVYYVDFKWTDNSSVLVIDNYRDKNGSWEINIED